MQRIKYREPHLSQAFNAIIFPARQQVAAAIALQQHAVLRAFGEIKKKPTP